MSFVEILQVFRWKNLGMLAFVLSVFRIGIVHHFIGEKMRLSDTHFLLFLIAILIISAAGYLINDIRDIEIDRHNNPSRVLVNKNSTVLKKLYQLYFWMNIVALMLSTAICLHYHAYSVLTIFVCAIIFLAWYAYRLKKVLLVGNVVIASLTATSIISIALFESSVMVLLSSFVLGGFAFLSTLLREYIKDAEDMEGDRLHGVLSIPIVFGIRLSKYFGFAILGSLFIALSFIAKTLLAKQFMWAGVYVIVFLMMPYIAILYLLIKASTKSDFSTLSTYTKIIMLFGILSVLLTYIQ